MAARKTRSKKTKAAPAPVEVVETPIVDPEPIPTPEPEFDIVFVPDDELDIVFTPDFDLDPEPEVATEPDPNSKEEVAKRVEAARKIMADRLKEEVMFGLTQTSFGRGKIQYRRRSRREEQ